MGFTLTDGGLTVVYANAHNSANIYSITDVHARIYNNILGRYSRCRCGRPPNGCNTEYGCTRRGKCRQWASSERVR
jgi:hypothetical protein